MDSAVAFGSGPPSPAPQPQLPHSQDVEAEALPRARVLSAPFAPSWITVEVGFIDNVDAGRYVKSHPDIAVIMTGSFKAVGGQ